VCVSDIRKMTRNNNRNKKRNMKKKRPSRPKRAKKNVSDLRLQLSNIENKPIQSRSIRYRGIFSSSNVITLDSDDMVSMLGFVNNTSTAFYPLMDAIKINSITISAYCINGNLEDFTFTWLSPNAPEERHTLVCQQALLAHQTYVPPEDSSASWWQAYGNTPIQLIRVRPSSTNVEVIMDINFRYTIADGSITSNPLSVAASVTGLVARSLPNGSGFQFVPVDLVTAT